MQIGLGKDIRTFYLQNVYSVVSFLDFAVILITFVSRFHSRN